MTFMAPVDRDDVDKELRALDPFAVFDAEAERLDRFFAALDDAGWAWPSRCAGWSVRDVLGHLAGEELYNHACLDDDLAGFSALLAQEGITGYEEFNEWCVRQRRGRPVTEVLAEWRDENGETRRRMRALGRDAMLPTSVGPYPVGLQAFHYASEYATHADDVGAPVDPDETAARTRWRVLVGRFALAEQGKDVQVEPEEALLRVRSGEETALLAASDFVAATVGRLPAGAGLDERLRAELRCLA